MRRAVVMLRRRTTHASFREMPMSADERSPARRPGFGWSFRWPPTANGEFLQFAPDQLWQPINPGWSFGNLIVNNNNSSAPNVEHAVLNRHSYGRQIGRLLDVVEVLVKRFQATTQDVTDADKTAIGQFEQLLKDVREEKEKAGKERRASLQSELEILIKENPQLAKELLAAANAAVGKADVGKVAAAPAPTAASAPQARPTGRKKT